MKNTHNTYILLSLILSAFIMTFVFKAHSKIHSISFIDTDYTDTGDIKEKETIYPIHLDTVDVKLPYAYIGNRQLKSIVDALNVRNEDGDIINTPIFLYMFEHKNRIFEWWLINPDLNLDENFYSKRAIGYYKIGRIYIIIDSTAKSNIKILPKEQLSFKFLTNHIPEIFNIEPVLELDIKKDKIIPTLKIGNDDINWFRQYQVE